MTKTILNMNYSTESVLLEVGGKYQGKINNNYCEGFLCRIMPEKIFLL